MPHHPVGRRLRTLLLALAAVGCTLAAPRPALAHAGVVRTDPPALCAVGPADTPPSDRQPCTDRGVLAQPPAAVRIWLSEAVTPAGGGIRVRSPSGRRVDRGPAESTGPLLTVAVDADEEGTYLVVWQVISADTHPGRGTFTFAVDHESAAPGGIAAEASVPADGAGLALQSLGRALHFAGYALGFGLSVVAAFAVPLLATDSAGPVARRLDRLVWTGLACLLVAEPIALVGEVASLAGPAGAALDPDLVSAALGSSFGRALAQRIAAAVLLWVLVGLAKQAPRAIWAIVALGLGLALADGGAAHAASAQPTWLGFAVNAVHVAAMGAWLGGLAMLIGTWRLIPTDSRADGVVRRVGVIAVAAVATLAFSGSVLAAEHLAGVGDLAGTAYGRVLAVKVTLAVLALLLAGAAALEHGGRPRLWRFEASAVAAVLVVAGLLVSLPPPR